MLAGFGQQEITPPLGIQMEGFNLGQPASEVHDALKARALAFRQGRREAVVVGLDLISCERGTMDRCKGRMARELGLAPQQILINFSHNHSGPHITRWYYRGTPAETYLEFVETRVIAAVEEARNSVRPVEMKGAMGRSRLPMNRRRINAQGQAEWGPDPHQPVCRALPLCVFEDGAGDVVGYMFSVSCHPTINHEPILSAEYPGAAVRMLNEHFGTQGGLFLQGAGGDAKPANIAVGPKWKDAADFDDVEVAGRMVAEDVVAAAAELHPIEPNLGYALTEVRFGLEPAPTAEVLQSVAGDPATPSFRQRWAREMLQIVDLNGHLPTHVPVLMHELRLGKDARLIGLEAELGSELGEQILRARNGGIIFPLGYTNGVRINLPCDRQLPQGGYGVDTYWEYHWPSKLASGIDAKLADVLRRHYC